MNEEIFNEMSTTSERLIALIRSMPESEIEKILFLIEGTRIGTIAAKEVQESA